VGGVIKAECRDRDGLAHAILHPSISAAETKVLRFLAITC
jgi:hypothetical protein